MLDLNKTMDPAAKARTCISMAWRGGGLRWSLRLEEEANA